MLARLSMLLSLEESVAGFTYLSFKWQSETHIGIKTQRSGDIVTIRPALWSFLVFGLYLCCGCMNLSFLVSSS